MADEPLHDVSNRPSFHRNHKPDGPSYSARNIEPDDVNFLPYPAILNIGVQGDITIVDLNGYEVLYENYLGRIPVYCVKVLATNNDGVVTTAQNIVAEF